jgi:SAM-dependent methyltransferase
MQDFTPIPAARHVKWRVMAMLETDKLFAGSIPENYDRHMVPLIFEPYAADLAQRVASFTPDAVLEIAAGTGVVTRALAPKLSPRAAYVVTDLNHAMLDYARSRQIADSRIQWQQADAMVLPFDDSVFDIVCCQFGAMFFPDRPAAYRQARRVLKPGGHFLFNVWDGVEENVFADDVRKALATIFPDDPPRFIERTPHGYHDIGMIELDLIAGGFAKPVIERVEKRAHAASALDVATGLCQGTPIRSEIEARGAPGLMAATEAVAKALERRFGSGPIEGAIAAFVVSAERA